MWTDMFPLNTTMETSTFITHIRFVHGVFKNDRIKYCLGLTNLSLRRQLVLHSTTVSWKLTASVQMQKINSNYLSSLFQFRIVECTGETHTLCSAPNIYSDLRVFFKNKSKADGKRRVLCVLSWNRQQNEQKNTVFWFSFSFLKKALIF